ncbi:hypothetical protein NFT50_004751 [Salmonella enterica]|nr:hypothetical protein [Salmonella enterica]EJH7441486.1 hypothetical protein [Salmonella enterica]EJH7880766.1 hypothetical protein [Salmonella enterica]EJI6713593.1 hypothetical protein [Salmonella enterica]
MKDYVGMFSFLESMGFLPLLAFNNNRVGGSIAWIKSITPGSRIYSYFYITRLRGDVFRFEFLVAPEIYLDSMPELTSICFYQKILVCESYDEKGIDDAIKMVGFLLKNEKSLEKSVMKELIEPTYCTHRRLKPDVTTKRHLIHIKRLDLALDSPWLDEYINGFKKKKKLDRIIPSEHESIFDAQLIDFFNSDFALMDEYNKEAALERWTAYFLYEYLIANNFI